MYTLFKWLQKKWWICSALSNLMVDKLNWMHTGLNLMHEQKIKQQHHSDKISILTIHKFSAYVCRFKAYSHNILYKILKCASFSKSFDSNKYTNIFTWLVFIKICTYVLFIYFNGICVNGPVAICAEWHILYVFERKSFCSQKEFKSEKRSEREREMTKRKMNRRK